MDRKKIRPTRFVTLRTRLALSFIAIATLLVGIILVIVYSNFQNQLLADIKQRLLSMAEIAASQQDGDAFLTIQSDQDPAYDRIRLQNLRMKDTSPDIAFIYTMRYDDQGIYFVVDAVRPGEPDASAYGDRYLEPGPALVANYRNLDHAIVEDTFYEDEFDRFLSAYAPFYTSSGQFAGIIGVDIRANDILGVEQGIRVQYLLLFLFSLPIVGLAGWLFGDRLAKPIKSLTEATAQIAQGDLGYRPEIKTDLSELALLKTSFYSMANQTQSLIGNLEKRVAERTRDLEIRSSELQAAARIIRDVSSAKDIDELLGRTARLLRERFSYYHVGIFLIDDNREYAVLRAAGGEAGQLMLANNHKLKIGEVGMVGHVTKTGEPRIALDVGADAVHFRNPLLPYTRSEMVLPLEVGGKVIGAVDIQSDKVNAFNEDDITIMQILTDQLSVAVEKEELIQRLSRNITAVEQLSEDYTLRTWESFTQHTLAHRGYRYRGVSLELLEISEGEFEGMLVSSKPKIKADGRNRGNAILNVPIKLRDQVIGVMNIEFQEKNIPPETKGIIEQAVGRMAIALENARLVQDARRLAERERQVNIISAQVQQSTNLETVLQNTIRELGNTLGAPNTFIQIGLLRSEDKE